jgi:hypothetical protein
MEACEREDFLCMEKKKRKKEKVCEESFFSFYVWRGVHGKGVCKD